MEERIAMPEPRVMMTANTFHIDPNDGSPSVEYRIENGRLERRTVEAAAQGSVAVEAPWKLLTAEQVASEVVSSPAFARWLSRRLGVYSLLRACCQRLYFSVSDEGHECRHYPREFVIGELSPLLRGNS
jgi:hypothetical protein